MNRDEALELLRGGKKGIAEWNRRKGQGESIPNLARANLDGVNLRGANLSDVDFTESTLTYAEIGDTRPSHAELQTAGAIFVLGANTANICLKKARLQNSIFDRCSLVGADLTEAVCSGTTFRDVDLSSAIGLQSVLHKGPSTLGLDTLLKSRGKIPEVFLRGCGVPENLIKYLPSLVGGPAIQFYSCFISYSGKNEEFAKRLHLRMREEKLRVWFAPDDIKGGEKLHEQIDQAIRLYDKLLLVLSEESMGSEWVKTEIYLARQREINERCRILFPIRLVDFETIRQWECFDADTGKDLAREIREYFIPDFSNWKDHDALEAGFARLLQDLQAGDAEQDQGT